MMRRAMLACLLPAALAAQTPAGGEARPISLDEAVRLARRNAPATVQARGTERTSRAAVRSAYAAFIPNLSVSAGSVRQFASDQTFERDGQIVTLNPEPWSYSTGLNFNVDLFDGGRRFFNIGSAKAAVDAAEANEVSQQFRVALDVKQQFFNVLAARESEAAARAQLGQAEQQLRAASARVAAGVATKSDSLRSIIQLGNAQLALLTSQNNLRSANAALTRLVATPFLVTAAAEDTLDREATIPDSADLARLAIDGPAVRQAEANLTAAKALRRAAQAPYLPSVTASYSRGGSGIDRFGFGSDPYSYNGSLRFGLSYPLFNQFNREENNVRAAVARDNAEAALRDARFAAQQSLVQFLGVRGTAEQRIRIQQASVAAAEEDLRVQQQRYGLGASTLLDLLTSQTQLDEARAALIAARYDYRVANAQLEALIGREF
ncbi:MAG: TolC family protein [Anaerolineae bacterium]|nr:TolC family protein [Gemmatimonadaceae bacterium]